MGFFKRRTRGKDTERSDSGPGQTKPRSFLGRRRGNFAKTPPTIHSSQSVTPPSGVHSPVSAERELIRRQLFTDAPQPPDALSRIASTQSVEVTRLGQLISASDDNYLQLSGSSQKDVSNLSQVLGEPNDSLRGSSAHAAESRQSSALSPHTNVAQDPLSPINEPFDQTAEFAQDEMEILEKLIPLAKENPVHYPTAEERSISNSESEIQVSNSQDSAEPAIVEHMHDMSTLGLSFDTDALLSRNPSESMMITETVEEREIGVMGSLCNTLQCGETENRRTTSVRGVVGMFYDSSCRVSSTKDYSKPHYDEAFTKRFIRRMTTKGAALLYLQAPGTEGNQSSDWKGRTVAMLIQKGTSTPQQQECIQPRLEWSTVTGGQTFEVATTSIGLLDIMSISASSDDVDTSQQEEEDSLKEGLCFFTITSKEGDVYMFESNSQDERNSLVNGLKNVISRLSWSIVVGDIVAVVEMYQDATVDDTVGTPASSCSLPGVLSPKQTMTRVTHLILN